MRRKNISKINVGRSKIPGESLLIDISYIKRKSLGGKDTWLLIEDQATSLKWCFFMRRKGELIDEMINFIKSMRSKNPESIKFIRLDNTGENLGLKSSQPKGDIRGEKTSRKSMSFCSKTRWNL
jgi:hypothetical protein